MFNQWQGAWVKGRLEALALQGTWGSLQRAFPGSFTCCNFPYAIYTDHMVLLPKACIPTILPALVTPVSGGACLYSPFPSKDPLLRCILHDQIYTQRDMSAVSVTCWFYNVGPWFSAFLSHTAQRAHVVPPLPWFSFGKALICFGQSVSPKHS